MMPPSNIHEVLLVPGYPDSKFTTCFSPIEVVSCEMTKQEICFYTDASSYMVEEYNILDLAL